MRMPIEKFEIKNQAKLLRIKNLKLLEKLNCNKTARKYMFFDS